jgi:hypothetical protein
MGYKLVSASMPFAQIESERIGANAPQLPDSGHAKNPLTELSRQQNPLPMTAQMQGVVLALKNGIAASKGSLPQFVKQ